jgi:hypothetical protein
MSLTVVNVGLIEGDAMAVRMKPPDDPTIISGSAVPIRRYEAGTEERDF